MYYDHGSQNCKKTPTLILTKPLSKKTHFVALPMLLPFLTVLNRLEE
jgi:hypothetical protein